MNHEAAKAIYDHLVPGWHEAKRHGRNRRVRAPYREDEHASLDIDEQKLVWFDRGTSEGGGAADLARRTLGDEDARALLREIGDGPADSGPGRANGGSPGESAAPAPPPPVEVLGPPTSAQIAALKRTKRLREGDTLDLVGAKSVRCWDSEWLGFPTLVEGSWKLWALNHNGVPRIDDQGKLIRRNAGPVSLVVSPALRQGEGGAVARLWDVEGESDFLACVDAGLKHVVAPTGGAGSLAGHERHRDWLRGLAASEVVVVRDRDDAGRDGAQKAASWWRALGIAVRVVDLPEALGKGGDLRDYLNGRSGRGDEPAMEPIGNATDLVALADAAEIQAPEPTVDEGDDKPQASDLSARLAGMAELEYQQSRADLAKEAGIGVGALDQVRKEARRSAARTKTSRTEPVPWPDPVNGLDLADGIERALRRFVVLGEHAFTLVTLWAIGTHAYAARSVWPLLLARSPQPACGKSTLLDVLERLVARPFIAGNASLATLFRSAAKGPTQLLDELDRWLERDPEIVGFLCAGWQSGRPFVRCHPETHELQEFPCFGPRALALIGDLADEALRSRCVVVEMRRALPGERPERFRAARPHADLAELQAQAARWAADHTEPVGAFELADEAFEGLSGRSADNAEALLSVAEAIGGDWPTRCREAIEGAPTEEPEDLGAMLLADLGGLLEMIPDVAEAVPTKRIIEHLGALEDRPWPTLRRGEPLDANGLRRRLKPFGIKPGRFYIDGPQVRGYLLAPIREAIARYLPPSPRPSGEVSYPSCRLAEGPSDAHSAPESPPTRQQDTQDTSPEGSERGGIEDRAGTSEAPIGDLEEGVL